jgi:hypothetical protein
VTFAVLIAMSTRELELERGGNCAKRGHEVRSTMTTSGQLYVPPLLPCNNIPGKSLGAVAATSLVCSCVRNPPALMEHSVFRKTALGTTSRPLAREPLRLITSITHSGC